MKIIDLQKAIDNYESQTGSLPKYIEMSDKSLCELEGECEGLMQRGGEVFTRDHDFKINKFNDIEIRTFPSVSKWCWLTDDDEFDYVNGGRLSTDELLSKD